MSSSCLSVPQPSSWTAIGSAGLRSRSVLH
uniref:Uncharacterized protein n=1 Tax=Anguilla anguilla TaxID=7936 RepID=A0A0E9QAI4_ANGAN